MAESSESIQESHPKRAIKRALDLTAAIGGLVVLAPLLTVVAVALRFTAGSPVLFRQKRPGLHENTFVLIKFRTMSAELDAQGRARRDEDRITRLGRLLRRTSLDELPELWNVLKGEMSLVGPRPLLIDYLPLYTREQSRRHKVKPGITGLAQVNGRNAIGWERRFELDTWYVDHWSLWLDLKILARTLAKVVRTEGISQEGHATMEPFNGSETPSDHSPCKDSLTG